MAAHNARLVLTGINQLIALVKSTPALQQASNTLAQLAASPPVANPPKKSCNCGASRPPVQAARTGPEPSMDLLTQTDFIKIKSVLGVNELCYYNRDNGKLALVCV